VWVLREAINGCREKADNAIGVDAPHPRRQLREEGIKTSGPKKHPVQRYGSGAVCEPRRRTFLVWASLRTWDIESIWVARHETLKYRRFWRSRRGELGHHD